MPTGKDSASFVSHLDPDANQRPRLSMSCHGDRTDSSHVFKAVMEKVETAPRGHEYSAATGAREVVHVSLPCDKPNGCTKPEEEEKMEPYQRMNSKVTMIKSNDATGSSTGGAATGIAF